MASSLESADPVFAAANGVAVWAKKRIDDGEGNCFAWNCKGVLDSGGGCDDDIQEISCSRTYVTVGLMGLYCLKTHEYHPRRTAPQEIAPAYTAQHIRKRLGFYSRLKERRYAKYLNVGTCYPHMQHRLTYR